MKYDWTKLDNGWKRNEELGYIAKRLSDSIWFRVYDDGSVTTSVTDATGSPERAHRLLGEAVAQRKRCAVDDRAERAAKALGGYFDLFTVTTSSREVTISTHCNFKPVPRVILSRRCIRVEEPIHLLPEQGEAITRAVRVLQEEP